MDNIRVNWKLEQELKSKAERENFGDTSDLVNFLLEDALKRNVRKNTTYVPSSGRLRPELKKGDLCRLSKRAKNQIHYGSKNATYVVVEVGNTVRGPYRRYGEGSYIDGGTALCRRRPGSQERRIDPGNGYCSIKVAYKKDGKWHKTSFHRKDLLKVNR